MVGLFLSPGYSTLRAQVLAADGSEYAPVGSYLGDQVQPVACYQGSKGFLVWQDNTAGGKTTSIVARQLSAGFSADLSGAFRVNTQVSASQSKPSVAMLADGSVAFAWQSNVGGKNSIQTRFLAPNGVFHGFETTASGTGVESVDPAIVPLSNGNALVVWSSLGLDADLFGIFARVFDKTGKPLGEAVQINQLYTYNQRNVAGARLSDGRVMLVWISEQQRAVATASRPFASCDVQGRYLDSEGAPLGGEFRVNTEDRICANPAVAGVASGGSVVAWTQRSNVRENGWDISASFYGSAGHRTAGPVTVNSTTGGDQIVPAVGSIADRQIVSWTSASGFRGARGSINAQAFRDGVKTAGEFKVNAWSAGRQMEPLVVSDGLTRVAIIWSSFIGDRGFDLHAQRYSIAGGLPKQDAPYVSNLGAGALQATWAPVLGYSVKSYDVQVDGGASVSVGQTLYTKKGLEPSSSHAFRVRYVLTNGEASPWSDAGVGKTWGEDDNGDLIPDDWQSRYWGSDSSVWPSSAVDSDGDGASNAREFIAGTDPTDKLSVLRQTIHRRGPLLQLEWNAIPGGLYQVQSSDNRLLPVWTNVGDPRLARSAVDSVMLTSEAKGAIYRIIRLQ